MTPLSPQTDCTLVIAALDVLHIPGVALATDFVIAELHRLCTSRLPTAESLLKPTEPRQIGARRFAKKALETMG